MTQSHYLSQRETEVINLLMQGKSNKQIAATLGIADSTVEFHLTNIYAKLQVGSRTEAILKLGKSIGGRTTDQPGKSRVVEMGQSAENQGKPNSTRRFPMKKFFVIAGLVLLTAAVLITFLFKTPPPTSPPIQPTGSLSQQPVTSSKEAILTQIRQAVDEYEQKVQSEKKNGKVKFDKDSQTGEEVLIFQDESYATVSDLNEKLWEQINSLQTLYTQIYRDETRPTPFPTQESAEANKTYSYNFDITAYCSHLTQPSDSALKVSIYSPSEGKYVQPVFGDPYARCDVVGQMLEELRIAPLLAQVNQDSDMATIRQIMGRPEMKLTFQSISLVANAVGRNAALYVDETGTKYYVDVETARLGQIEANFASHPQISTSEIKSIDELRGIASQFALTNSPRLTELKPVLAYEEGGKISIYFFTWRYNSKNWSNTDWAIMPPFIQVGVLSNGEIATYINTLDLFK